MPHIDINANNVFWSIIAPGIAGILGTWLWRKAHELRQSGQRSLYLARKWRP